MRQLIGMPAGDTILDLRDRAILKFYLATGARIASRTAMKQRCAFMSKAGAYRPQAQCLGFPALSWSNRVEACSKGAMPLLYSPHCFRVTTITDLLEQNVPREDVQHLAGHADPRTTNLYDRRERTIKKNIVDKISV
jgi:site-specific recombinase XerD